jgi:hypothetical protein
MALDLDKTPVDHDAIVLALASDAQRSVRCLADHLANAGHPASASAELRELLWSMRVDVLKTLQWFGPGR